MSATTVLPDTTTGRHRGQGGIFAWRFTPMFFVRITVLAMSTAGLVGGIATFTGQSGPAANAFVPPPNPYLHAPAPGKTPRVLPGAATPQVGIEIRDIAAGYLPGPKFIPLPLGKPRPLTVVAAPVTPIRSTPIQLKPPAPIVTGTPRPTTPKPSPSASTPPGNGGPLPGEPTVPAQPDPSQPAPQPSASGPPDPGPSSGSGSGSSEPPAVAPPDDPADTVPKAPANDAPPAGDQPVSAQVPPPDNQPDPANGQSDQPASDATDAVADSSDQPTVVSDTESSSGPAVASTKPSRSVTKPSRHKLGRPVKASRAQPDRVTRHLATPARPRPASLRPPDDQAGHSAAHQSRQRGPASRPAISDAQDTVVPTNPDP